MTPNVGVCSAGHIYLVHCGLPLTGSFHRTYCPECLKNDSHRFLYSADRHPHMVKPGGLVVGSIGACGAVVGDGLDALRAFPEIMRPVGEKIHPYLSQIYG